MTDQPSTIGELEKELKIPPHRYEFGIPRPNINIQRDRPEERGFGVHYWNQFTMNDGQYPALVDTDGNHPQELWDSPD